VTEILKPYPEDPDGLYYRPLLRPSGKVAICEMQWFDEMDYDQTKFLTEKKFSTDEQARQWVRDNDQKLIQMLRDRELFED
jgi:hypothetical protein